MPARSGSQIPRVQVAGRVDVDDQPALGETQILPTASDLAAHDTVGSVAADHVTCTQHAPLAGDPAGGEHPDPVTFDEDIEYLGVGDEGDQVALGDRRPQYRLQVGLVVHRRTAKAVPADRLVPSILAERPQLRVHQTQTMPGTRDLREGVGDTDVTEDAQHLVVEVHGPGLRVDTRPPFDDRRRDPEVGQQRRGGESGRPRTDDQNRCVDR